MSSSKTQLLSDEQVSDALQELTDRLIYEAPDDELTHFIIRDEMARIRPTEMTTSELDDLIAEKISHLWSVLDHFYATTTLLEGHHLEENQMKPNIIEAITLLRRTYEDQQDPTGSLLIAHPLDVLGELHSAGITDEVVLSASLLHDIPLYSDLTPDFIAQSQGAEVAQLVSELLYDLTTPNEDLQWFLIRRTSTLSERAGAIVAADLTANLKWMMKTPDETKGRTERRTAWMKKMFSQITNPPPLLKERFGDAIRELSEDRGYSEDDIFWRLYEEASTNDETSDLANIIKSDDKKNGENQC